MNAYHQVECMNGIKVVKSRRFFWLAALMLAMAAPAARADLAEVGHDIKQGTKEAAQKTGHAARKVGHATASAAKAVGHGVASAARSGYQATKSATKRVFHKSD